MLATTTDNDAPTTAIGPSARGGHNEATRGHTHPRAVTPTPVRRDNEVLRGHTHPRAQGQQRAVRSHPR